MSIGTESSIVLHLNSAFASAQLSTGLTTNFIYNLKESVEVPNHEMCQVSLYSATIPYSFYNVNSTNNQFRVTMNDGDDEKTSTMTIPKGNYTATSLKDKFISVVKASTEPLIASLVFDIEYDRVTFKYNMKQTNVVEYLKVNFITSGDIFGFANNTDIDFDPLGNATVVGSKCADLSDSVRGLYIRQNLTSKSTLDNETGTFSNILARIPIETNPGGIIFYNPHNSIHRSNTWLHSISSVGIKLTNDTNAPIDLNGLHFSVSLLVSFVPYRSKLPQRIEVARQQRIEGLSKRIEGLSKAETKKAKEKKKGKEKGKGKKKR